MNGSAAKIEIVKPFSDSFELTKKILFQPFDAKKWFVIGFTAWLSHLGGGGYNYRYNGGSDWQNSSAFQGLRETFGQIPFWLLISGGILLLLLIVIFAWLRARGQFMFVDCIVKDRAAVAEPWREFREQGNSYFLFALAAGCVMLVALGLAALPFMLPILRGVTFLHLHDFYLFSMIALWAALLVVMIIAWNLISHFMIAIMYRRHCRVSEGFSAALSLIWDYPGEITLYCLFWILLGIASAIAACATVLFTCCVALLPYIGTVIMLPLFVCLRGYGLLFVRQFGPEYDVWAAIPQPAIPPTPPPLPS